MIHMKKRNKTILAIAVVAAVAIAIFLLTKEDKKKLAISYETTKVERATIGNSVTATGTIEPVTEVEVGTQVSGIISKIFVDYNSIVHKGQVIAELDKTNLISELNSAKSNMASAKSELDYQSLNYKRMKTLHEKGLISDNDFNTASLSYKKAKNDYTSKCENVAKAQTNLGYATITSPIDGIVLSKSVEEGQTVAASYSTPTLFTIARDLTDMRVIAKVDEADIGEVKQGQRVTFTVDAYPNDTFEGEVTQVRQKGEEESNVITYEVVISAPNKDLKLKPELTATVNIYTMEREGVLSVPGKALRYTPVKELMNPGEKVVDNNAKTKVWVLEGKTLKAYAVQTGISNGIRTEILKGIKEGTQVIIDAKASIENDEEELLTEEAGSEKSPFAPGPPSKKNKK